MEEKKLLEKSGNFFSPEKRWLCHGEAWNLSGFSCSFQMFVSSLTFTFSSFSVVTYPVPEGQSGQQTVDILQKRVEDLGAVKTGNFTVDCDTYNTVPQTSKLWWINIFTFVLAHGEGFEIYSFTEPRDTGRGWERYFSIVYPYCSLWHLHVQTFRNGTSEKCGTTLKLSVPWLWEMRC